LNLILDFIFIFFTNSNLFLNISFNFVHGCISNDPLILTLFSIQ
jgi:hypothetical protein